MSEAHQECEEKETHQEIIERIRRRVMFEGGTNEEHHLLREIEHFKDELRDIHWKIEKALK